MTTPRAEPAPDADFETLRAWWLDNLGTVLELLLAPQLDDWLLRHRAGETPAQIATDPGLRDKDVGYLLQLWALRDAVRREHRGEAN